MNYQIKLPESSELPDQVEEYFFLIDADSSPQTIRLRDYSTIYSIPGL